METAAWLETRKKKRERDVQLRLRREYNFLFVIIITVSLSIACVLTFSYYCSVMRRKPIPQKIISLERGVKIADFKKEYYPQENQRIIVEMVQKLNSLEENDTHLDPGNVTGPDFDNMSFWQRIYCQKFYHLF